MADEAILPSEAPRRPTREWRAGVAFLASAAFTVVVLVLYGFAFSGLPAIAGALFIVGPVVGGMTMVITALGLSARRPWATWVVTPMLLVLAVSGTASFLFSVRRGGLEIPIAAVLALWALRAPLGPSPARQQPGTRGWSFAGIGLLVVLVLSAFWPVISSVLLGRGGPLIAGESELSTSVVMSCDPAEDNVVTFEWSWRRGEPWPAGTDLIALSWIETGPDGSRSLPIRSMELPTPLRESNRSAASLILAMDMGSRRFAPGRLIVTLAGADTAPAEHGSIELRSRYVHGASDENALDSPGVWSQQRVARCEW